MQWKGVVHGNVVVLDEGAQLPEGSRVTVAIEPTDQTRTDPIEPEDCERRQVWIAQVKAFGEQLKGRQIHLGNLVLESREELEERA